MPSLVWDHVVHYVNDLQQTIDTFESHGIAAHPGGDHPGWGTYNALSHFDLTYIEFLGIRDQDELKAISSWQVVSRDAGRFLPDQQILSRLALRTDDIETVADSLHAQGLHTSPILEGRRYDTEGQLIEWKMLTIDGEFEGVLYPFVIQWQQDDDARRAALKSKNLLQANVTKGLALTHAIIETEQPQALASHWASLFGIPLSTDEKGARLTLPNASFLFRTGPANRITDIGISTKDDELRGTSLAIGQGLYHFT